MTNEHYKDTRAKLGLTQAELAALLGVSLRTIANRESGLYRITRESQVAIEALMPLKASAVNQARQ